MWALVRYNKETVHFGVYMGEEGSVFLGKQSGRLSGCR
jgi:hypothetical protein